MPKLITINVTAEDIAAGKVNDCDRCPVALAANRCAKFEDKDGAWLVGTDTITGYAPGASKEINLPLTARLFVEEFDNGPRIPPPFAFTIEIPDWFIPFLEAP